MPYIPKTQRTQELDKAIEDLVDEIYASTSATGDVHPGVVNYAISSAIGKLLVISGLNYRRINMYIGILECIKLELYRRIASPYEDSVLRKNGDVFSEDLLNGSP